MHAGSGNREQRSWSEDERTRVVGVSELLHILEMKAEAAAQATHEAQGEAEPSPVVQPAPPTMLGGTSGLMQCPLHALSVHTGSASSACRQFQLSMQSLSAACGMPASRGLPCSIVHRQAHVVSDTGRTASSADAYKSLP